MASGEPRAADWQTPPASLDRAEDHFLGLLDVPRPSHPCPTDNRIALQEAIPMSVVRVTAPLTGRAL
jgi:hypothetical protein